MPEQSALKLTPGAAYVHYTSNETIGGVEFPYVPETNGVPLVSDMSSNILSRPMDVTKYGVIYASAQKNIGPSGLAVVIVREDLLGKARTAMPSILDYKDMAANGSMSNTPPTFGWYLSGLVFKWLKKNGGLEVDGRAQSQESAEAVRRHRGVVLLSRTRSRRIAARS